MAMCETMFRAPTVMSIFVLSKQVPRILLFQMDSKGLQVRLPATSIET